MIVFCFINVVSWLFIFIVVVLLVSGKLILLVIVILWKIKNILFC